MLFAMLDYVRYRRGKGIYSDANIRGQGGRLAVSENFHELESLGPGHLFLCHTRYSVLSWLVMYYTSSVWSHTGIFTEQGRIIDVTTAGVIEHPLSDYFDGKSFIVIFGLKEGIVSHEQLDEGLKWLRSEVGGGYDWFRILQMLWSTISGANEKYRLRFSADFLIIALILTPLACWSRVIGILLAIGSAIYLFTVIANILRRRAIRQRKCQSHQVRNIKGGE